jgi:hypothetical protein
MAIATFKPCAVRSRVGKAFGLRFRRDVRHLPDGAGGGKEAPACCPQQTERSRSSSEFTRTDSAYADAVMIVQAGKPLCIKPPKPQAERDQIFISYSHRDKYLLEQQQTHQTISEGE